MFDHLVDVPNMLSFVVQFNCNSIWCKQNQKFELESPLVVRIIFRHSRTATYQDGQNADKSTEFEHVIHFDHWTFLSKNFSFLIKFFIFKIHFFFGYPSWGWLAAFRRLCLNDERKPNDMECSASSQYLYETFVTAKRIRTKENVLQQQQYFSIIWLLLFSSVLPVVVVGFPLNFLFGSCFVRHCCRCWIFPPSQFWAKRSHNAAVS